MMNYFELTGKLIVLLQTLGGLLGQLTKALDSIRGLVKMGAFGHRYENTFLKVVVDIADRRGRRATVERRQGVRFLTGDSGVIRDVVWGDGNPICRYSVRGARRLTVRSEGSKRVILLGLSHEPRKGEQAFIRSRRLIRSGFTQPQEFYEMLVERPTERLALKVLFPRSRPPKEAYVVSSPPSLPSQKLPVQYASDGRPFLRWGNRSPDAYCIYSLRWSW